MAQLGPALYTSHRCAATVSAYRIVGNDTAASGGILRCVQPPTITTFVFGVAQQSGTTDQSVQIISFGNAKGESGQSLTAGALLTYVTATGYLIEAVAFDTTATARPRTVGLSLQTGAATGAVLEILVSLANTRANF